MSRTSEPAVTVLLPVYNGSRLLAEQIESVLSQTGVAVRLHIWDDASTDGSLDVCRVYEARDSRVTLHASAENAGLVKTVGLLAQTVQTPYFAMCDQDDIWDRDKLEVSIGALESRGAVLAYSDVRTVDEHGKVVDTSYWQSRRLRPLPRAGAPILSIYRNPVLGHTIVARREVAMHLGETPEGVRYYESWILSAAHSLGTSCAVERPLGSYRIHGHNLVGPAPSTTMARISRLLRTLPARQADRFHALDTMARYFPEVSDVTRTLGTSLPARIQAARSLYGLLTTTSTDQMTRLQRVRESAMTALSLSSDMKVGREKTVDVCFVLPGWALTPVGGYRVVYEYASLLAERGHSVAIVHLRMSHMRRRTPREIGMRAAYRALRHRRPTWFDLNPRVSVVNEFTPDAGALPRARTLVATSVATAPIVAARVREQGVHGLYIIQHIEDFTVPLEDVEDSWRLPLERIVVSRWLLDELQGRGLDATLIENGVDRRVFHPDPARSSGTGVLAMVSDQAWKRTDLVVDAFTRLSRNRPDLPLRTFGVCERPNGLPPGVEHVREPSRAALADLYRASRVYLCASDKEGFGLPALEAMSSGCAVVTTDNGGVPGFAGEAVLVVPAGDADELYHGVETLLDDPELWDRYRGRGLVRAEQLDTARSCDLLEASMIDAWRPSER